MAQCVRAGCLLQPTLGDWAVGGEVPAPGHWASESKRERFLRPCPARRRLLCCVARENLIQLAPCGFGGRHRFLSLWPRRLSHDYFSCLAGENKSRAEVR